MPNEPIMSVINLNKQFKLRKSKFGEHQKILHAVSDVSIDVYKGETLGIIGESGCGKSTLGRCLVRLHTATSGKILLNGLDINEKKGEALKALRKEIQMIFQDPYSSLNPRKTAGQIIEEPMVVHKLLDKIQRREKVISLMKEVGLNEQHIHRFPHEFSGGQRQRINIARALALNPDIIVCDEPVSALDVSVQAQVLNLLNDLQKQHNLTMVFISHDLSVIKHVSDRIVIMYLGRIVELCNAQEIYTNPKHPYTQALLSAIPPESPFEETQKIQLKGEIPSPIGEQKGCPFASRCMHVMDRCRVETPKLKTLEKGHQVACYLY
ncbi:ABC transporter ATP-binding protein [Acidaminobacter hydrogenoformans]|uniref:Oligopeptide transport system ATP-binding protein n=1 Tax=Acidaminobacter hydrogenoformans DSM 2784 TaxID=1120920 RepID=A0A1G5S6B3_9FIRM|nr:dipeptide ABC transporter ATP-binding protein [Acidaminobacter hydrogenoformans]SCZ81099.1 oligopeptide transport system ATP-binding protein [Acidaminobacter hydrogenoformans DSM 2784]